MSCLQSRFIASPIQLCPPNNKRQPVFIGHWPDIQEICSQNTQLCQMPAMWCGQAKHCSVSQFPHQEKWKQFVLLSHLTYINPQTFQTGLVSNHIEAQQQKRQETLSSLSVPSRTMKRTNKHCSRCHILSLLLLGLSENQFTLGTSGQCNMQPQPCLGSAAISCFTPWWRAVQELCGVQGMVGSPPCCSIWPNYSCRQQNEGRKS